MIQRVYNHYTERNSSLLNDIQDMIHTETQQRYETFKSCVYLIHLNSKAHLLAFCSFELHPTVFFSKWSWLKCPLTLILSSCILFVFVTRDPKSYSWVT